MNEFKIIKGKKGLVNIQNVQKFKNKHGWCKIYNETEQHHLLLDKKNGIIEYERISEDGESTIQHFEIGDSIVYDKFNYYYDGTIVSFTENNVIIDIQRGKNKRIGWDTFCKYQSVDKDEICENDTYWAYNL